MRDPVYCVCVFPMSVCFCVKQAGETFGAKTELPSVAQNRGVTVKERLKRGVNKLVVSHIPLPILSSLHCLSNLHPALLPEP